MSPDDLAAYLRVMREANLMQATLKTDDLELAVVFGPDPLPDMGSAPTPGGWKSPQALDDVSRLFPTSEEPEAR